MRWQLVPRNLSDVGGRRLRADDRFGGPDCRDFTTGSTEIRVTGSSRYYLFEAGSGGSWYNDTTYDPLGLCLPPSTRWPARAVWSLESGTIS